MSGPRPGLAVERTVLAWTRAWLSTAVCALLLLRLTAGSPPRTAAALLVGAATVTASTAAGHRRATRLRATAPAAAEVDPGTRAVPVTATTVTLLGVAAAVLVALH